MDSEFLKERLAEADSQYTDLLEQLEPAREKWLNAEDPKTKDDLRAVYDDIMSMVDKTGTRIVQLEARIMNGKYATTMLTTSSAYTSLEMYAIASCYQLSLFQKPASLPNLDCSCVLLPLYHCHLVVSALTLIASAWW